MRLFAAADLPAAVRAELAAWGSACADAEQGLRPVAAERLHLTLVFLGARDDPDVLGELVTGCSDGVVEASLGDALWLAPRRPHVLTVALTDPTGRLADLQARVVAALRKGAGIEPEGRAWRPHVTVARVRRGARVRPGGVALPRVPRTSFAMEALTLYRSHPGPAPRYEALARARLE